MKSDVTLVETRYSVTSEAFAFLWFVNMAIETT